MATDRRPSPVLTSAVGTLGEAATAAFVIAAATGVVLAVPYSSAEPVTSIATLLLSNPAGVLFRNIHFWSAQTCFLLVLLHVWDHLRARTERRVTSGVWLRLALALPVTLFLMLSGFLLRGDADAQQALRLLTEATATIPVVGASLATLVFGAAGALDIVYVQHAATATIVVWLFVIEHSRRVWPRAVTFVTVLTGVTLVSLVWSPGLHDGLDPVVKGPWYFLGLQEILHWTPWPAAVVAGGALVVAAVYLIRVTGEAVATRLKRALLALAIVYSVLCGVGAFMRGAEWTWSPTWPGGPAGLKVGWIFARAPEAPLPAPLALGRPEGCLVCHKGVTGLGNAHKPEAVGCASCHGGDVFTLDKTRAHRGMELIPGGLATAAVRCGLAACHPTVVPRVERSIMSTMRGIIAVNRSVFGDGPAGGAAPPAHVRDLGRSAADTHLRQLCASCHLGQTKTALGPNGEDARGGGCNACHLTYDSRALGALRAYEAAKKAGSPDAPAAHPAVSLDIPNTQCVGCHSRSSRISTSYEGWHERHEPASAATPASSSTALRTLADGRVFERVVPDIHHERGMDCIDCHTVNEVMGDGASHARKSEALRVTCVDCHVRPGAPLQTVPTTQLDPESRKILAVRQWPGPALSLFGRAASGEILVNVVVAPGGAPQMVRKRTGERRPLKPALPVCTEGRGHSRLSCGSCHTAWAPRCPTCHTSFDANAEAYDWIADADVKGAWKEQAGAFVANAPTLGVRRVPASASRAARESVDTFVPGMVMTLDLRAAPGRKAGVEFRRLYSRIEPHTTRREARSCESCHNSPEALGYGRGTLAFVREGATGRWVFTAAEKALPFDGLPADAWIPFLGTRTDRVSTRDDVRPFTVDEQRRILTVGACLTCHPANSPVMRDSVKDFTALMARRSRRCMIPAWVAK